LTAPGRLDANKCLSYWTIEAKGPVPEEIAAKTSGWIFGCDICQDVCPWNRKPKKEARAIADAAASAPDPSPDGASGTPAESWPRTAREWLALLRKQGGFRSRFRRTPLARAGRKAMLRNVLLALRPGHGDFGDVLASLEKEEDDPALRAALQRLLRG
jgi:epoxyqueuosine reductase